MNWLDKIMCCYFGEIKNVAVPTFVVMGVVFLFALVGFWFAYLSFIWFLYLIF